MPQHETVQSRIQSLDERLARLRMEKSRLQARANQAERKRDTRRKILIGGAVLAAIDHEGVPGMTSKSQLLKWLDGQLSRSHDRAVFDLPARTEPDAGEPVGPLSSSPRPEAAVKDARPRAAPRRGACASLTATSRRGSVS